MKNINKYIYVLLIAVLLLLVKCLGDTKREYNSVKKQSFIEQHNAKVLQDSVKYYKTNTGSLVAERGVLILEKNKLLFENKDLYFRIKQLEKTTKIEKPLVVIEYVTQFKTDTVFLKTNSYKLTDSTYLVSFQKDTVYGQGNFRHLSGDVFVSLIPSPETDFNTLQAKDVRITKDITNANMLLVLGTKDNQMKVWLESEYPGLNVESIQAITLDTKIHPELRKLDNRKHSIGLLLGFGIVPNKNNASLRPFVGIGYQYSLIRF